MQKVVLALDIHDDPKCKKRVIKIVTSVPGIDSVSVNSKEQKVTVIGNMDVLEMVNKLRKTYRTDVITVGPAKEPEKPKENMGPEVTRIVNYVPNYYPYYYPTYYIY